MLRIRNFVSHKVLRNIDISKTFKSSRNSWLSFVVEQDNFSLDSVRLKPVLRVNEMLVRRCSDNMKRWLNVKNSSVRSCVLLLS
ncbi:hypothetical protein D3C71_1330810 [compost metagenome]